MHFAGELFDAGRQARHLRLDRGDLERQLVVRDLALSVLARLLVDALLFDLRLLGLALALGLSERTLYRKLRGLGVR
jgi:AraC-like DNA-binding protein